MLCPENSPSASASSHVAREIKRAKGLLNLFFIVKTDCPTALPFPWKKEGMKKEDTREE